MSDRGDYYAVSVEFLFRAQGMMDARLQVERYFDTQTLDLQDHGFEEWELRNVRGVTTPHVKETSLSPSPRFRGKFTDEKKPIFRGPTGQEQAAREMEDQDYRIYGRRKSDA